MGLIDMIKEKMDDRQYGRSGSEERPSGPERGLPTKKAATATALALAGVLGYFSFQHTTGNNEIGVKFNKWTGSVEMVQPGQKAFFPPVINDWYTLDTKLLNYAMTGVNKSEGSDSIADHGESLGFKTPDGNDIALELTVLYQKDPSKAETIIREVGSTNEAILEKLVRPFARSLPRDYFGTLPSNDFADAKNRNAAALHTSDALRAVLMPYGILASDVQSKDFVFVNKEYRDAVHRKKLADGDLPRVISAIDAQKEINLKLLGQAEQQKQTVMANADGSYNQAVVSADAYLQEKKASAEGILAEGRNMAAAIRKERESMASSGGKTLVAMELARKIQGVPIIQIPQCPGGGNIQLQDARLFELLGIQGVSKGEPKSGGN